MISPAASPGTQPSGRVPYLDGLRGIAILLVVAEHFVYLPYNPARHPGSWLAPVHHLLGATWAGVDLFFVLSGFLLGGILLDHRAAPNLLRVFYLRRACRILPPYFLFLTPLFLGPVLGIAHWLPAVAAQLSTGTIPAWVYPLFGQNLAMTLLGQWGEAWISITWSLAVEEQFYLVLPAVILLTSPRRLPWVLAGLALLAPILRTGLHLAMHNEHAVIGAYTMLPCRWDSLLLGVLAAWLVRDSRTLAWLQAHARLLPRLGLLFAAVAAGLVIHSPFLTSRTMGTAGYSVFALLFATVVMCAHLGSLPGRGLLEWAPLRWVGRVSYTLYLVHLSVCSVLFHLLVHHTRSLDNARDAALMAAGLVCSLLVAGVSWRLVEQPILNFARQLGYREPSVAANSLPSPASPRQG